jgi:hypothetical protein
MLKSNSFVSGREAEDGRRVQRVVQKLVSNKSKKGLGCIFRNADPASADAKLAVL